MEMCLLIRSSSALNMQTACGEGSAMRLGMLGARMSCLRRTSDLSDG